MKFGTFLFQTSPSTISTVARKAEELGFESLWIPEHIILPVEYKSPYPYSKNGRMPAPPETPLHDPMLVLAFAAGITNKIRLATGIYVLPIRNAITTAKAVASLDVLSGGRFIFGIGIGWLEEEFEAVGMNYKDRAARTREYLAVMKELWTKDDPNFDGKTIHLHGVRFNPKPLQKPHPPVVFGGGTDPSLKRTARLGDGWYGIAENLDETHHTIARLREYEKSFERARPLELTVAPRLGGPLTLDQVRAFREMGVERILLGALPSTRDQLASMERFRDEIMNNAQ
jgi:probable F420-dependent oxidoreductase